MENVVIWTFGRLLDGGRKGGWECQGVNWTSPLPGILAFLARLGIFRQAAMQRNPLAGEGGRPILEYIRGAGVAEVEGCFVVGVCLGQMWHPRHVRNPQGGEVTVSLFVSHPVLPPSIPPSLPPSLLSFSLVQTDERQETRLDFVVMCDQTLVVLLLAVVVMIVVEESLVVGE